MRRLRSDLRTVGFEVWTDETGLEPGTPDWEDAIESALRQSGCLVVILSPDARASRWVGLEIAFAEQVGLRIFPILVRGDKAASVPMRLLMHQRIDAREDYETALASLRHTLAELLGVELKPSHTPNPSLALTVSVDPRQVTSGGTATWAVRLRNDGNLDMVSVTLSRGRRLLEDPFKLPVGESMQYTFSTTVGNTPLTEQFVATGVATDGQTVKREVSQTVGVIAPKPPPGLALQSDTETRVPTLDSDGNRFPSRLKNRIVIFGILGGALTLVALIVLGGTGAFDLGVAASQESGATMSPFPQSDESPESSSAEPEDTAPGSSPTADTSTPVPNGGLDSRSATSTPAAAPINATNVGEVIAARTLIGHPITVESVAFSPDGTLIASGGDNARVFLWDATTGQRLNTFREAGASVSGVSGLAWSPDGTLLTIVGTTGGGVIELASGEQLLELETYDSSASSVAWSPDGATIATTRWRFPELYLWDVETGEELPPLEGHSDSAMSVAWSPDGARLVSGSRDRTLMVWDAESGIRLNTLTSHTSDVNDVAWSPDGTMLASASRDQTVMLWDATTGAPLHTLRGHTNFVESVAFNLDGTLLASAGRDEVIKLWDSASGDLLSTLEGHFGQVLDISWSPDGTKLVSASLDGSVIVWAVGQ